MSGIDRLAAYRQAGVDLDASNVASQIAGNYARETWDNAGGNWSPVSPDAHLAASKVMPLDEIRNHPGTSGVSGTDGTGTKPEFYERQRNFYGLGHDLVAMAVDDIPAEGGQAVWMNNGLIVNTLNDDTLPHIDELFRGLRDAANQADVVLWTGEIAVHGNRLYGPTDFSVDWIGDAFGLVHEDRVMTGARVQEGDVLYGFAEPEGFRCNGISLVRKTLWKVYGPNWESVECTDGVTFGELVATPSTVYAGLMRTLTGGYDITREVVADIHGVAHISGGSLPEKIGRMLRISGLGADITDPFDVPYIQQRVQFMTTVEEDGKIRPMTDEELYSTWHGGQGYVVAASENDHDALLAAGESHNIEIKPIGQVVKQPGLRVVSKGSYHPGELLNFAA